MLARFDLGGCSLLAESRFRMYAAVHSFKLPYQKLCESLRIRR